MKKFNKEDSLKRLTEMVVKGEDFIETAKEVHKDFEDFEDELSGLIDTDKEFMDLQVRSNKILKYLTDGK